MVTIKLGEREDFAYDVDGLAIQVHDASAEYFPTARIEFFSLRQASHFKEMLECLEDRLSKKILLTRVSLHKKDNDVK
jgi:hypothetical protein